MSHISLRRRFSAAITTAITALGLGLVAPTGAAVGAGDAGSAAPQCRDAPPQARLRPGADGVDPNSVSAVTARAMHRQLRARTQRLAAQGMLTHGNRGKPVRVRTAVHVITREDGTGDVTDRQIRRQIQVFNQAFGGDTGPRAASTRFEFVLRGVDRTANDTWYDWGINPDGTETDTAKEAKQALHVGRRAKLNVYVAGLQDGLLGYATFPQNGLVKLDGVVLLNESLPGGTAEPYNEGDTAVHEVGHWLGLFHTFQDGCAPLGDHVRDTPHQLDGLNVYLCDEDSDTCPQARNDPVHNYMNYSGDPCLDKFTIGQARRMHRTWFAYRAVPQRG